MSACELHDEIERVAELGGLGRSPVYLRLLKYLADASLKGECPREIDIAIDVFGKNDYAPGSDATVRVYLYNLRRKLDEFYSGNTEDLTHRLRVPKGKYAVVLTANESRSQLPPKDKQRSMRISIVVLAATIAVLVLAVTQFAPVQNRQVDAFASTKVWRNILDDNTRILLVVGDYFMFAEGNERQPGDRLIRDFRINNPGEFSDWMQSNPDLRDDYMDIRLSYLPEGIAPALADVLRVLNLAQRDYFIVPQSRFQHRWLRDTHVIYIGYVSGMGPLEDFTFAVSNLSIGESYDELVETRTGELYQSSAGIVAQETERYVDYALISTFPTPGESQFLVISGLRDEGLTQAAAIISDPVSAARLGATTMDDSGIVAFESLFKVIGAGRTYIASHPELEAPIDLSRYWDDS